MGQRHYVAMLEDAQSREFKLLPAVSSLLLAGHGLGPYTTDPKLAFTLARKLQTAGWEFKAGLIALIESGAAWIYFKDEIGQSVRCRDTSVFDSIFN